MKREKHNINRFCHTLRHLSSRHADPTLVIGGADGLDRPCEFCGCFALLWENGLASYVGPRDAL